jgi:hypothetical protein
LLKKEKSRMLTADTMIRNTTQKECAITVTTRMAGQRNPGNAHTKNFTLMDCAKTVTSTSTTR